MSVSDQVVQDVHNVPQDVGEVGVNNDEAGGVLY